MPVKIRKIKIKPKQIVVQSNNPFDNYQVVARKKKKKQQAPRPTRPKRGLPAAIDAVAEEVCALTNAVCAKAYGMKLPDKNQSKTMTYSIRGLLNVNTYSTTGETIIAIVPGYSYGYSQASSMTNGTGTMGNLTVLSGTSAFVPSEYRVVSMTVKVQSITAPLSASGGFIVAEIPGADTLNLQTIDLNALTQFSEYKLYPLAHYEPVYYHFRRGGIKSDEFEPQNGTTITAVDTNDWPVCIIGVLGGPTTSTNVVRIEYTAHYELKFPTGSPFIVMSTPPLGEHPKTLQALSNMPRTNTPIIAAANENDANTTLKRQAIIAAARAAGGWFGGDGLGEVGAAFAGLVV
jgi:hypothetical protein